MAGTRPAMTRARRPYPTTSIIPLPPHIRHLFVKKLHNPALSFRAAAGSPLEPDATLGGQRVPDEPSIRRRAGAGLGLIRLSLCPRRWRNGCAYRRDRLGGHLPRPARELAAEPADRPA